MKLNITNIRKIDSIRSFEFDNGGYHFRVFYSRDEFMAIPNHHFYLDLTHEECSKLNLKALIMDDASKFNWTEYDVESILAAIFDF